MTCPTPRNEGDEQVCSRCALRWDAREDKPPCPQRKTPTLDETAALLERDYPGAIWVVGKCDCGSEEGGYSARAMEAGTKISEDGLSHYGGWLWFRHGRTAQEALANVYGSIEI